MKNMIIKTSVILPDTVQEFQIEVPNIYSHVSKAQFNVSTVASLLAGAIKSKVGNNVKLTANHKETATKGIVPEKPRRGRPPKDKTDTNG